MRSPDRARAKAVIGVLLSLLAAYALLLHWWWTAPMLAMGEEIAGLQQEALELRMESAQREQLRAELARLSEQAQSQGGFLSEANKELASAALVQRLESVVTASVTGQRCKVTARTPIESTAKEPFTRVAIQVRLQCGMSELAAVLHALEGGSPQLFIDNLDVLSRRAYLGAGEAASGALDISFDLYGYLHGNRRGGQDD